MTQKHWMKYFFPIIILLLLLVDAQITIGAEKLMDNVYVSIAHFALLAFLMSSSSYSKNYLLFTSLILGILCDSYYLGVIGIYAVALPATVMMMYQFKKIVHTNFLTAFFGMIIFVTMYEISVVTLQFIFQLSYIVPVLFITKVLGPTLVFNMLIFIFFAYPLKKILNK